ncbi:HTH DNA binding domain family protein [Halococcus salifodinae DSM 8989]|uniref:HTH DNA binding domain family protein n=1 Tax=Halococcus salifodinae DSM 8989 TaxID=1227456 RepID=M0MZZ0_9EURY|nr:HTH DNA binding domain family protein [Halococcus salifodinae DSM 8989]
MARSQFRFEVPGELGALSTAHPETEFRIVSNFPTTDGLLVILDIEASNFSSLTEALDEEDQFPEYEVLHADDQRTVIQYEISYVPAPHHAILSSGNLIQFPLPIRDGWAVADLTTSRERLSQLRDAFEAAEVAYDLGVIQQSTDKTALLTDRQREFIVEAVERGYYESPRQCTLTELAESFDVSKGAASGILHRAERRIIKRFLGKSPI